MTAERGWIGDPQPPVEWRESHYSRTLKLIEEVQWVEKNAALSTSVDGCPARADGRPVCGWEEA
jgi:hypothetical protein